jgi:hypothetical protein
MMRLPLLLSFLLLGGCAALQPARAPLPAASNDAPLAGEYDNHSQVWAAGGAGDTLPPPHVRIVIQPVDDGAWSLWHIRLDAQPPLQATWAMQRRGAGPDAVLLPHRASVATPAPADRFAAAEWTPLDACALHATGEGGGFVADAAACALLAPGIGPAAALLPLAAAHAGDTLRLRLYADQARGPEAHEEARRVVWFTGWAAVNGAGPTATATADDWHMDRTLALGSEGGRAALPWRDGSPSGYSLRLERLAYRDGDVPVLKLSVVEDASGAVLAYAWANPEATRIGINLGWLQAGLERGMKPAGRPD